MWLIVLVKIFTLKDGLEVVENVSAVRLISNDYNLLILKDYVAIIGKVEGTIEIESEGGTKKLDNTIAYYVSHNNVFNLMIEGE